MSNMTGNTLIQIGVVSVGIYLFLFTLWRGLKEDIAEQKLFTHALIILLASALGGAIFKFISGIAGQTAIFNPSGLWLWGSFTGFLVGSLILWFYSPLTANVLIEILVPSVFIAYICVGLVTGLGLTSISLVSLVSFVLLKKFYKKFHWYKSGKVGFAALVSIAIFFSLKIIIALQPLNVLFSVGRVEILVSLSIIFLSLFSLLNLSKS